MSVFCHLPATNLQDGPTNRMLQKRKLAHKPPLFHKSKSIEIILSSIQIIRFDLLFMLLYTLYNMNQASVNGSQDPQHDATKKSESWDCRRSCSSKHKFLHLSMNKSFLPRSITPTKEEDALQLAWDILNDKVSLPCWKRSDKSSIRDNQNDTNSDEGMETTDHSASSLS